MLPNVANRFFIMKRGISGWRQVKIDPMYDKVGSESFFHAQELMNTAFSTGVFRVIAGDQVAIVKIVQLERA